MTSLLLSLLLFTFTVCADDARQFNCPNGGEPKLDEGTGRPVQCLPGHASSAICGATFSCFFSGFNYQCCPSIPDEMEEKLTTSGESIPTLLPLLTRGSREECPAGSIPVLDLKGVPLKCNSTCPQLEMFCYRTGSLAQICCERLNTDGEPPAVVPVQLSSITEQEQLLNAEKAPVIETKRDGSVQIGGGKRKKRRRKSGKKAHANVDQKQPVDQKRTINSEMEMPPYLPNRGEMEFTALPQGTLPARPSSSSLLTTKQPQIVVDTSTSKKDVITEKEAHNCSSYICSSYATKEDVEEENPGTKNMLKSAAQEYLLQQIKDGWPYADKFYRPANDEDIVVLRKHDHPTAIVHFPTKK